VIVATGWRPYDATKLDHLGCNKYPNVITNVQMERIAANGNPITRPSDNKLVENAAFVQCAGSRDENHLPYCSAVCCMASLKQTRYLRDINENSKVTIFYIDIRAIGRHESFFNNLLEDDHVAFIKGKAAEINEAPDSEDLIVDVEDTISRKNLHMRFDMVVLATGMEPYSLDIETPFHLEVDGYGFLQGANNVPGVYAVGCAKRPCDVSSAAKGATSAALKAIQLMNKQV